MVSLKGLLIKTLSPLLSAISNDEINVVAMTCQHRHQRYAPLNSLNSPRTAKRIPFQTVHVCHIEETKWQLSVTANSQSEISSNLRLDQDTWMFQKKYPISYEVAYEETTEPNHSNTQQDGENLPILLLNGFGVGSYHQHRLMRQILLVNKQSCSSQHDNKQYVLYAIDYLGQGKSWPIHCNDGMSKDELDLGYSADMWIDQLEHFMEEIIIPSTKSDKVHIVGNSVGGYLGTMLAYRHPQKISSLTLLNATPVWGLNLPFWDGRLPAPPLPKFIGRTLFDIVRNIHVIQKYIEVAYVYPQSCNGMFDCSFLKFEWTPSGKGEPLANKIKEATESKGAHAAFASILWSPPASKYIEQWDKQILSSPMGFYDALRQLPVDVLLIFGSDDKWCIPAVAKRMHSTLASRKNTPFNRRSPSQRYIALKNVGHCPNHEAPTAVAKVLLPWLKAASSFTNETDVTETREQIPLVSVTDDKVNEPWGEVVIQEVTLEESKNVAFIDRIISFAVG